MSDRPAPLSYARPLIGNDRRTRRVFASIGVVIGLVTAFAYGEPLWWTLTMEFPLPIPPSINRVNERLVLTLYLMCFSKGVLLATTCLFLGYRPSGGWIVAGIYLLTEFGSLITRFLVLYDGVLSGPLPQSAAMLVLQACCEVAAPIAIIAVMLLLARSLPAEIDQPRDFAS